MILFILVYIINYMNNDLEVIFLFPFAVSLYYILFYGFWVAIIFLIVLTIGSAGPNQIYVWLLIFLYMQRQLFTYLHELKILFARDFMKNNFFKDAGLYNYNHLFKKFTPDCIIISISISIITNFICLFLRLKFLLIN